MDPAALNHRTGELFAAFERGRFDDAAALLADGATITQNGNVMTWQEARPMLEGLRPSMGAPSYADVRRTVAGSTVIEEHTVRSTTSNGHEVCLHAAVALRFDNSGKIAAIDEYVDPGPLFDALRHSADGSG